MSLIILVSDVTQLPAVESKDIYLDNIINSVYDIVKVNFLPNMVQLNVQILGTTLNTSTPT